MAHDKELLISTNKINVSNRKNQSFYVYLCKKTLEKYDSLELHALGNASTVSVIAAESLVKNGYAEYEKLDTETIEVEEQRRGGRDNKEQEETEDKEGENKDDQRKVKRAKLLITLKKSKDFDLNMEKFKKIKE